MTYCKNVSTLEELRKQYQELLKKYHPDNANGSTEATQEINAEYNQLFKILKDKYESRTADSKDGNAKTDFNNSYEWILRCGGAACPVWREPPVRTFLMSLLSLLYEFIYGCLVYHDHFLL